MPVFQTSSDNINFDRGDVGFAYDRIVDISAVQMTNCRTYQRVV